MPLRNFYIIVYDVVDDKRRLKIAKYLESIGERAQKSVFEVYLNPQELEKLL
jgi:CRISPR-associated protein Cas2